MEDLTIPLRLWKDQRVCGRLVSSPQSTVCTSAGGVLRGQASPLALVPCPMLWAGGKTKPKHMNTATQPNSTRKYYHSFEALALSGTGTLSHAVGWRKNKHPKHTNTTVQPNSTQEYDDSFEALALSGTGT